MISGHESGMFPDSIFLLVEDEWVKDCIEGLIGYCRHIQHDWWRSCALGSRMSPVTTDNEKKTLHQAPMLWIACKGLGRIQVE